ncbi:MAG: lipase, partial [Actinomycetota bacterium]|nr:lipase [Actinomycetota bacterium]
MMLRDLPLEGGPVEVRGALELDRTPDGLLPRRLPAWTRTQLPDVFMNTIVQMTSGVRVAFTTDSSVIELVVHPRTIHTVGSPFLPPVFQMVVDGAVQPDAVALGGSAVHVDRVAGPEGITFEHGAAATLRWQDLGAQQKAVEIWFPTNASVEIQALRVASDATVTATPVRSR